MPDSYFREDYDPSHDASHKDIRPAAVNNQHDYDSTGYYAPPQQQVNAAPAGVFRSQPNDLQKPSIAPMVVLAVINMLCCAFGVGFILGLIALILALIAANEDKTAAAVEKLKAAKIVNIVGIVLSVLQFILIIFALIFFLSFGRSNRFDQRYNFHFETPYEEFPFDQDFDNFFDDFQIH